MHRVDRQFQTHPHLSALPDPKPSASAAALSAIFHRLQRLHLQLPPENSTPNEPIAEPLRQPAIRTKDNHFRFLRALIPNPKRTQNEPILRCRSAITQPANEPRPRARFLVPNCAFVRQTVFSSPKRGCPSYDRGGFRGFRRASTFVSRSRSLVALARGIRLLK
jgi:hypothetical protein